MARTIQAIQAEIYAAIAADPTLSTRLTSTSKVAIWRLLVYVYAVAVWTLEQLFDSHKAEVSAELATRKPHTLQWYVEKAKSFQYGDALVPDTDYYDPISEDAGVRIVTHAAAVEFYNLLRIKLAKGAPGALSALSSGELLAASAYLQRIKDAGVRIQVTSDDADNLRLQLVVYYDPLVLDAAGERLDGTSATPVKDAINTYLSQIPFNGLFVLNRLIDAIEATDGVVIGNVLLAQANYAATPYVPIPVEYTPDAGYLALDETYFDATVIYTPHIPV